MKISDLDQNFAVSEGHVAGMVFASPLQAPFRLYGLLPPSKENSRYRRMPHEVAERVSIGVRELNYHTAGGRIRFQTDSTRVAIRTRQSSPSRISNMTMICAGGFDLYADDENGQNRCYAVFVPPYDKEEGYESIMWFPTKRNRTVTIHFPLYGCVSELLIGLDADASLAEAAPYRVEKPVIFYGSSITQGGCASRAGTSYESLLSMSLNLNYRNLGFSGNAKGEAAMANYIAAQEMSAFVLDYDHNAPTVEHLGETHYPFYQTVRKHNPTLPILLISRPFPHLSEEERKRLAIVKETYERAKAEGDTHIWFLDGSRFFPSGVAESALVDLCHPNDLGFYYMAKGMEPILTEMLGL
jgi:hypothetical protein